MSQVVIRGYPLPKRTTIVLGYGWRLHPAFGQVAFHSGVDLLADANTSVLAVADGTVAFADQQGSYGKLVVLNHDRGVQTRYAQLADIQVQVGQVVKMGDRLGSVGSTGAPSSIESHLHFEVRYSSSLGWVAEDPTPYLTQQRPHSPTSSITKITKMRSPH
jgi:lysostaphin